MGNFGHINYGSSIVSNLFYFHKSFSLVQLGQVFVPNSNLNGCDTFTEDMFVTDAKEALFNKKSGTQVPVILLERGNCTFVEKVRNVEKAGA